MSSRYLRVFPSATVFGWTKTAPGKKARSELSLPYHLAHIARLTQDRKGYFENPLDTELDLESSIIFTHTLLEILRTPLGPNSPCSISEEDKIESWLHHGGVYGENPYYFLNPDLRALPSLSTLNRHSELLLRSKQLNCLLKKDLSEEELMALLDEILSHEQLLGYNFNSLWELMNRFKDENPVKEKILQKLSNSSVLDAFVARKLNSPRTRGPEKNRLLCLLPGFNG